MAIIDIRMPGINGLELCEQLRRRNEKMQLIIASGYAEFASPSSAPLQRPQESSSPG